MRPVVLIPALLLAACNNASDWENEQAELANDLNGAAPAANESDVASETDYLDANSAAANDVNAASPAANDINTASPVENEPAPPPAG